jgi:hypothetical protein
VKEQCPDDSVWPVQKLVVFHTQGVPVLQKLVMTARNVSEELAFMVRDERFRLCRGTPARFAEMTGLDEVRRSTPIIKFQKGQRIVTWNLNKQRNPLACRQCNYSQGNQSITEQERLAEWNRTGWPGFYASWKG